eukprot:Tamp_30402.p2 GENE.Tamp_30402~~Tamp_30402.p2  ORF type:complete len:129 (-),score=3.66 Tamp_30402:37-423(-)
MLLWWRGGPLEPAVTRGAQYTLPAVVLLRHHTYLSPSLFLSLSLSLSLNLHTQHTQEGRAQTQLLAGIKGNKVSSLSLSRARALSLLSPYADAAARWNEGKHGIVMLRHPARVLARRLCWGLFFCFCM